MLEVKVLIRKATIEDLKDILRLNRNLFLKEYREFDRTLNINWTHSKEGKKLLRNVIVKKDNFCEVIQDKNRIVGYLNGGIAKRSPWHKEARYAYLGSIFIEKKFRRRGLGTKLINDFINWCKRNKFDYIDVTASAQNIFGQNFYRKAGFNDYDLILEKRLTKN